MMAQAVLALFVLVKIAFFALAKKKALQILQSRFLFIHKY